MYVTKFDISIYLANLKQKLKLKIEKQFIV